jgi:hypothetical protein
MSNVCIKQLVAAPEVLQSLCCHLLQGNLLLGVRPVKIHPAVAGRLNSGRQTGVYSLWLGHLTVWVLNTLLCTHLRWTEFTDRRRPVSMFPCTQWRLTQFTDRWKPVSRLLRKLLWATKFLLPLRNLESIFDVLGYCVRIISCFSLHKSTVLHVVFLEYGTWSDVFTEAYDSTKDIALCL